jgi:hypothetical protein
MKRYIFIIITILLLFASPALATDYYFSTSGSDAGANNCETYSSPCKSIERANDLQDGWSDPLTETKRVLFLEGDTWSYDTAGQWASSEGGISAEDDKLRSYSDGTASYRLVYGAYDSGGNYVADSSNKPVFDYNGNEVDGEDQYDAVLVVRHSYVTVENIRIQESGASCLRGDVPYGNSVTNLLLQKLEAHDCHSQGIWVPRMSNSLITENVVTETSTKSTTNNSCANAGPQGYDFAVALGCNFDCENNVWSKNIVYDNYGEGIGIYFAVNTVPNIIEKNIFSNNRSAHLHASDSFVFMRWNVGSHYDANSDGYSPYWRSSNLAYPLCGPATGNSSNLAMITVYISPQSSPYDNRYIAYGNLFSGMTDQPGLSASMKTATFVDGDTLTYRYFNNTIVDGSIEYVRITEQENDSTESYIINNIAQHYEASPGDLMVFSGYDTTTCDYNLWSKTPGACTGSNDIDYPSYTGESDLERQSGWRHPTAYNTITWKDYRPTYNSDAKDQATHVTTVHADDIDTGTSLIVTDAFYFCKDTWIEVNGDITKVTAVSYGTGAAPKGTLTISPGITRAEGEEIRITPYLWDQQAQSQNAGYFGSEPEVGGIEIPLDNAPSSLALASCSGGGGDENCAASGSLTYTRNNQANTGTDYPFYANTWKIVSYDGDCDGAAIDSLTCDKTDVGDNSVSLAYSGLSPSSSVKLCVKTYVDWDDGSDCDDGEESAGIWTTKQFSITPAGGPASPYGWTLDPTPADCGGEPCGHQMVP